MTDQHKLYINGEWIETNASVTNVSPSDTSDVIGHYAQASTEQVEAAIT
jgi:aldehyde dehydrogenase (NAD+)